MKNVLQFTNNFFEQSQIVEKLLKLKPTTSQGKTFKTNILEAIKTHKLNMPFVAKVIVEGRQVTLDTEVENLISDIQESISKNKNAVRIAFLFEKLKDSEVPMVKNVTEAIEEVILEGEDGISISVLSGKLAKHKSTRYQDLLLIESEAINESIKADKALKVNEFTISNPVSYVEIHENEEGDKTAFVRIENDVFQINENSMMLSNAPSKKFVAMSNVAKNVQFKDNNVVAKNAIGTFIISENGISKFDLLAGEEMINESSIQENIIEDINETIKEVDFKTRTGSLTQKQAAEFDNVIAVSENWDSFAVLDDVVLAKNTMTNESCIVATQGLSFYGGVLESNKTMKQFKKYSTINEAIEFIKNKMNIDLSKHFEKQIQEAEMHDKKQKEDIEKVDEKIQKLEERLNSVKSNLSLLTEGSDAHNKYVDIQIKISESLVKLGKERKSILEGYNLIAEDLEVNEEDGSFKFSNNKKSFQESVSRMRKVYDKISAKSDKTKEDKEKHSKMKKWFAAAKKFKAEMDKKGWED